MIYINGVVFSCVVLSKLRVWFQYSTLTKFCFVCDAFLQFDFDSAAPPEQAWRRRLNSHANILKEFSVTFTEAIKMVTDCSLLHLFTDWENQMECIMSSCTQLVLYLFFIFQVVSYWLLFEFWISRFGWVYVCGHILGKRLLMEG